MKMTTGRRRPPAQSTDARFRNPGKRKRRSLKRLDRRRRSSAARSGPRRKPPRRSLRSRGQSKSLKGPGGTKKEGGDSGRGPQKVNNKFYVTTPIYYVNDIPHIGHAYTTIAA